MLRNIKMKVTPIDKLMKMSREELLREINMYTEIDKEKSKSISKEQLINLIKKYEMFILEKVKGGDKQKWYTTRAVKE